jgi:EAL domain-containing protein (putative c-di-GMP-specific phosphodiesterase class I)
MQGYYFSSPVAAAEFGQMLREGRALALEERRRLPD